MNRPEPISVEQIQVSLETVLAELTVLYEATGDERFGAAQVYLDYALNNIDGYLERDYV